MAKAADEFVVDFPTLWIVPDWIEAHCPVPDGFRQGDELELYRWQLCSGSACSCTPTASSRAPCAVP